MNRNSIRTEKLHGRKKSRTSSQKNQQIYKEIFPKYKLDINSIDFNQYNDIELEVGFGYGEHLIWQALNHPNKLFLGAEPFRSGVINTIREIERHKLNNIRIHDDNVIDIIENLPNEILSSIFILFPDPWPKKRHHKRRFISQNNLKKIHHVLKNRGRLVLATDHKDYLHSILLNVNINDQFEWLCENTDHFYSKPYEFPKTKYERKAIKNGRRPVYLTFEKINL
ncbi:MAG: tRNA (guanosine(46)-N7)-methyltransferase TrmB [Rhodobiaceae bacterium]|nr:tRNA (guanosine(46)-N7)-methyltransferase TrmB [Rhodobiaceae bacterium]RPF97789.1 MAG: tRNA (guanosine(46)-N7)-methyltransferase TrmB [Rhizobiales bacterium TMED227]